MKITLQRAFDLLSGCKAVIIDGDLLAYPPMDQLTGEEDNQFMGVFQPNLRYIFEEGENKAIEIEDSVMRLIDDDGDVIEIELLFSSQLSSFCQESDIILD